jgi:hypothetical protein
MLSAGIHYKFTHEFKCSWFRFITLVSKLNLLIMFGDVNAYSTMRGLAFSKGQRLS